MSSFDNIFKQCEDLARTLRHPIVTIDHLSSCVLEKKSIKEFFNTIDIDIELLKEHVDMWLTEVQYPVLSKDITSQIGDDERVPFTPMLSRVRFELGKQSVLEQLKSDGNTDAISAYFMLIECMSFPETAIVSALELMGKSAMVVCRHLQEFVSSNDMSIKLNVQMFDSEEDYEEESEHHDDEPKDKKIHKAISQFTTDLTELAKEGKLTKLIGRESELFDLTQVLSRKNKKNAALVGEAGVGKTQIADGLAYLLISENAPETLKGSKLLSLNLAAMTAGTKFRGDLEERVESLIRELSKRDDIILFIDEMHTIMSIGGSNSGGGLDFGNMLKPALSRGDIRVVGATTYPEYRKHIEKDTAIARRFMKIDVDEPSNEETLKIVKGVKGTYEKFHKTKISTDAINSIMEYSQKYLQNKKFPDKAIDLMDAACARKRVASVAEDSEITVERSDIAFEVSRIANIPLEIVLCEESTRMKDLPTNLKSRVFGQDDAVDVLVRNVMVARAGLRDKSSVQGAFMFVGPSGTGKTELSKALADAMGVELIRFDMSEYAQEHNVSKLIGSPPGYVGHDSGNGMLLDKIEQNPNCVLLLDEIEKANKKILLTFLQVLDEGRLTGSHGKTVYFNNVTVIMTTNLGARDSAVISTSMSGSGDDGIDKAIKQFLPPEFINRIDSTVKFNELGHDVIGNVVDKYISELNLSIKSQKVKVKINKAVREWLIKNGVKPGMGARPMKRLITESIRVPLAQEMLCGYLIGGGTASFKVVNDKIEIVIPEQKEVAVAENSTEL